jgi:hypothetical protein
MIKINYYKSVYYFNEYNNYIFRENKEQKWFNYYLIKNNKIRFYINSYKLYRYYDQEGNVIKEGRYD